MILLFLIGTCLVVGFLLHLPFMLWFRHRRRRGGSMGREIRWSGAGVALMIGQLVALLAGVAAGVMAPESALGSMTRGVAGPMRWMVVVVVVSSVLEMVLRRAGVALERRPTATDPPPAPPAAVVSGLRRPWRLATLRGVPWFVDASLPAGGLLVAACTNAGLARCASDCLWFAVLVAVHELGHVAAARAQGLKVYLVHVSGLGGTCFTQAPRGVRQALVVYSGGLAAQAALLSATVAAAAVLGAPQSTLARSAFVMFTVVNLVLAVMNLVPGRIGDDLSTDGAMLWDLLLHVVAGKPHPLAGLHARSPVFPPGTRLSEIEGMAPPGFRVGIELLNDDATPMAFVVEMLREHLRLDEDVAAATTLEIHRRGGVLLALDDGEQARAVAAAILREARDRGHPLVCRAVDATTG